MTQYFLVFGNHPQDIRALVTVHKLVLTAPSRLARDKNSLYMALEPVILGATRSHGSDATAESLGAATSIDGVDPAAATAVAAAAAAAATAAADPATTRCNSNKVSS